MTTVNILKQGYQEGVVVKVGPWQAGDKVKPETSVSTH